MTYTSYNPADDAATTGQFVPNYPNTLIFVDLPSDDPAKTARFYADLFGWVVEGRPEGEFHRCVPGQNFMLGDGTQSAVGNLHLGIYNVNNARPHPDPAGVEPRVLSHKHRQTRIWILVSDDDNQERLLDRAEELGATILWRKHYWKEFSGYNGAFEDAWGNEVILWTKGGDNPDIPSDYTVE
jgi:hypothetical protein